MDPRALALNVRMLREARGWNQSELAYEVNRVWKEMFPDQRLITIDWVRSIEATNRVHSVSMDRVLALAHALDVPVSRILPPNPEPEQESTAADIAIALRNYGIDPIGIDKTLAFIEEYKAREAERKAERMRELSTNPPKRPRGRPRKTPSDETNSKH